MDAAHCLRRLNALSLRRAIVLPIFALIAVAFVSPLFLHAMNLGHGDWLWHHFVWEAARKSWIEFHEPGWWNPYYCGGNLGVANPQGFALSPFFLMLLPLPTAIAMKAHLAVMTFVGLWGTYELARDRGARGVFAIVGALFFACSGFMGWHMNGQTGMAAFDLLPWAVLFYLRAARTPAWAIASGAALACMILSAGVYPSVLSGVTLALHALVVTLVQIVAIARSRELRSNLSSAFSPVLRAIRAGAIAAASMVVFASLKLFPLFDFLRDHRRPIPTDDAIGARLFLDALIVKRTTLTQIWPHEGYAYAWWGEYGNYIGWAGIAIALIAIFEGVRRRRVEVILLALFVAILLGEHGSFAPYHLLRSLPMLGNLRVPTRYFIVVDLWLALLVALAGHDLFRSMILRLSGARRQIAAIATALALSLVAIDLISTNGIAVLAAAMPTAPAPEGRSGMPYHQVNGHPWQMYKYPPLNQGTLRCFDEVNVEISPALRASLPSEAFVADTSAGTARITSWSPSTWRVAVELDRPATLVLNQNVFRGWSSDAGPLVPHDGLIAVELAAGTREVTFTYRPPGFVAALLLTTSLIVLSIVLLIRARRSTSTVGSR